ncbi:hypothetical protein BLOT_014922 [Blomia tropicalis]|nr:hypothetical protein BLOT_014922 [Blomia tropicalis]
MSPRILISSDTYGVLVIALIESNEVDLNPWIAFRKMADSSLIRLVMVFLLILEPQTSEAKSRNGLISESSNNNGLLVATSNGAGRRPIYYIGTTTTSIK